MTLLTRVIPMEKRLYATQLQSAVLHTADFWMVTVLIDGSSGSVLTNGCCSISSSASPNPASVILEVLRPRIALEELILRPNRGFTVQVEPRCPSSPNLSNQAFCVRCRASFRRLGPFYLFFRVGEVSVAWQMSSKLHVAQSTSQHRASKGRFPQPTVPALSHSSTLAAHSHSSPRRHTLPASCVPAMQH
mmetsp:Transcript_12207/g.22636  ORF Transcript_12207/g.22636 Transcript_12207/m.22636 type:complete len:190 (-) Transcript_12207:66-635(-)